MEVTISLRVASTELRVCVLGGNSLPFSSEMSLAGKTLVWKGEKAEGPRGDPKAPAIRTSLLFTENPVNIGLQREKWNPHSSLR